jgi:NTP pyrophosphatase (non-canonical NTP hydrolase)
MNRILEILEEIRQERKRQDKKFGVQNHSKFKWVSVLTEEVGEVAKAALDNDTSNYREELIQISAVAVAMIESDERQNGNIGQVEEPLTFTYKNSKDEVSTRTVRPITLWYGSTKFHQENQWFLRALDLEKNEERDFAFSDIVNTKPGFFRHYKG